MKWLILISIIMVGCNCNYNRNKIASAYRECMTANNFDKEALTACSSYANSVGYTCDSQ